MDGQVAFRAFFAALFALSLASKIRHPLQFTTGLREYALVPDRLAPMVALLIGAGEATTVAGLLVLPGPVPWVGTVMLMWAFAAAQSWSIGRGRAHACHCFGGDEPVGPLSLGRSLLLGLVALAVLGAGSPWRAVAFLDPGIGSLMYVASGLAAVVVASAGSVPATGRLLHPRGPGG